MKKVLLVVAVAAFAAGTGATQAATTFDTDVTTPPGVFFGIGNSNGGFTVETDGGIELGLRAQLAIVSDPLHPVSTNVYNVPEGSQPAQINGIPAKPARSAWGITYSINVAGTPSSLSQYIAELAVVDTTTSTSLTTWDVLGNSSAAIPHVFDNTITGNVAQNAENAAFFSGLNFNSLDDYTFTLSIFNNDGAGGISGSALAADTIVVNAQPTPLPSAASMGLGMLAVVGAAGLLRKKLRAV